MSLKHPFFFFLLFSVHFSLSVNVSGGDVVEANISVSSPMWAIIYGSVNSSGGTTSLNITNSSDFYVSVFMPPKAKSGFFLVSLSKSVNFKNLVPASPSELDSLIGSSGLGFDSASNMFHRNTSIYVSHMIFNVPYVSVEFDGKTFNTGLLKDNITNSFVFFVPVLDSPVISSSGEVFFIALVPSFYPSFGKMYYFRFFVPAEEKSSSLESVSVSYDFDCQTGNLSIYVNSYGGDPVPYASVSLIGLPSVDSTHSETSEYGIAIFHINSSGKFKLKISKEGYEKSEHMLFLETCPSESTELDNDSQSIISSGGDSSGTGFPSISCTSDSVCGDAYSCVSGSCVPVSGECGFAENHTWVSFECCSDSDCGDGESCVDNICVQNETKEGFTTISENRSASEAPSSLSVGSISGFKHLISGVSMFAFWAYVVVILFVSFDALYFFLFGNRKRRKKK